MRAKWLFYKWNLNKKMRIITIGAHETYSNRNVSRNVRESFELKTKFRFELQSYCQVIIPFFLYDIQTR